MTRMRVAGPVVGALLVAALATPASAQQDARWAAFIGCWVPTGAGDEAGLLCFRPAGAGVEMFNVIDSEVTASEPLVADGVARPVTAEGCTGNERIEFSDDGLRAYTRSEFQCAGEPRSGTGIMSFVSASEWIDVRSLTVAGEPVAWLQSYELAAPSLIAAQGIEDPAGSDAGFQRAARVRAARGLEIAHVEDAASRVSARAVEVWLAAHDTPLELSGSELVRLADAGVPETVIDVMVAVSYPERFRVSPEGAADEVERTAAADYPPGYRRGYRAYLFSPFYRPFGYELGYSRYGYYGLGVGEYGYGGYWGYVPATIVVTPAAPSVTGPASRMVPGRGYSRGGNSGSSSGGDSGGGAQPSRSSGGGGGDNGGSNAGGSSSGSSGSSSGRTAQPRN